MTVIGLITPDRYSAPWEFVKSILRLKGEYKFSLHSGARLDENRNSVLADARSVNADVLLMIDTDMVFTPSDVTNILRHIEVGKADYVSGWFHSGHVPHNPCIWSGYDEKERKHIVADRQPDFFRIYASGLAFVAISKKLMQALPPMPFNRLERNKILLGGDLAFSQIVRELGFDMWCDPSIKIGHVISTTV